MPKVKANANVVTCFAAGLLVLALGFSPINSLDLGFHLATGRFILENLYIPDQDVFSQFSPTGVWPLHQGLSAVAIFMVYKGFGFWGLKAFLTCLMFAVAITLVWSQKGAAKRDRLWLWIFSFAAVLLVFDRWELRPDSFSAWFLVALFSCLQRMERDMSRSNLFFIFLLFFLWPSVHAGFIFGVFFFILWLIGARVAGKPKGFSPILSAGVGGIFGLLAVGCYNPGGLYGLLEPFIFSQDSWFQDHVAEYLPLDPQSHRLYFWVALVTTAFFLVMMKKIKGHFQWVLPCFVFLIFSFFISRMKIYAIPTFFLLWLMIFEREKYRTYFETFFKGQLVFFLFVGFVVLPKNGFGRTFDSSYLPDKALHWIKKVNVQGHVFNEDAWGGWISFYGFPQVRVFIDNRLAVYGPEYYRDWYMRLLRGESDALTLLKVWDVDHVFLRTELRSSVLAKNLMFDGQWTLAYFDDQAMFFTRSLAMGGMSPLNAIFIESGNVDSKNLEKSRSALELLLLESPSALAFFEKSRATYFLGNVEGALEGLDSALSLEPCHFQSLLLKAELLNQQGQPGESVKVLVDGIGCWPDHPKFREMLAKLHFQSGFMLKSQRVLRGIL